MNKVWYITGASKGIGLTLTKFLLENGERVAATSRSASELSKAIGAGHDERFLPLQVDLSSEGDISDSLSKVVDRFGRLDVIVNNAGYGIGGAIEELSSEEIGQSITINLMATVGVIKSSMPYLRKQRSGHIINISSIAGAAGTMGWSVYSAAKAAIIGLSEGLAQDVNDLGIRVTVIAPGAFRTEFLSNESLTIAENTIADYGAIHANHNRYRQMNGLQLGDPLKLAKLVMAIVQMQEPPVVLFAGSDAYTRAMTKMNNHVSNLERFSDLTMSTDH